MLVVLEEVNVYDVVDGAYVEQLFNVTTPLTEGTEVDVVWQDKGHVAIPGKDVLTSFYDSLIKIRK